MVMGKHWEGETAKAVKLMTKPEGRSKEAMEKMEYLFPGFWDEK